MNKHLRYFISAILGISALSPYSTAHADNGTTNNNVLLELNCQDVSRSSFIERVCYDEAQEYMLIRLSGRLYHYCDIEVEMIRAFLAAPSMGAFYNAHIKGRKTARPYDCRI